MKRNKQIKTPIKTSYLAFALFVFACFAVSPQARATCQEGCLTNNTTVLGDDALLNNTGTDNTAIGFNTLLNNTIGHANTAIGFSALFSNTIGNLNTATGWNALYCNTSGFSNTATGAWALYGNMDGFNNTATGWFALISNTTGSSNAANGTSALLSNTTGSGNTAIGSGALGGNTTGINNTALGNAAASRNGDNNTAIGYFAHSRNNGSNNIAMGYQAGFNLNSGSYNIDIGSPGSRGDHETIRIGSFQTNTYMAGISGATVPTGVAVIVDADGHLGTSTSSARFKDEIKPMDKASEVILALKPVTFHYKKELDPEGIPQFGLVAEEVEKVNPDLVARDEQGKPYTVRYEAVNAMLLNEFLKEHRKVQEMEANATKQQKQIDALTAGLQKVSAQLELSKSAPQTVSNNH